MMTDADWMAKAIELGAASRGQTAPEANVGCVIVLDGKLVGEGRSGADGCPAAEVQAALMAGERARGSTAYISLEPCHHELETGSTSAEMLSRAGVNRVLVALLNPRHAGRGIKQLQDRGIVAEVGLHAEIAVRSMKGFLTRVQLGRPFVTLKLAMSIDGKIATPTRQSRWITSKDARRDVHLRRAASDMILVGRGTYEIDQPRLDVRLPGFSGASPRKGLLTRGNPVEGWIQLSAPEDVYRLRDVNDLLIEGGAGTAAAFLSADLVDRLLVYRAPIIIGEGLQAIDGIEVNCLSEAHGRWELSEQRSVGMDTLEVYERSRTQCKMQASVEAA